MKTTKNTDGATAAAVVAKVEAGNLSADMKGEQLPEVPKRIEAHTGTEDTALQKSDAAAVSITTMPTPENNGERQVPAPTTSLLAPEASGARLERGSVDDAVTAADNVNQQTASQGSSSGKPYGIHQSHWIRCEEDGREYLPISTMLKCLGTDAMPEMICSLGIMKVELYKGHTLLAPAKIPGMPDVWRLIWLSAAGGQSGCLREAVPEYCLSEDGVEVIMDLYLSLATFNLFSNEEKKRCIEQSASSEIRNG